MPQRLVDDDKKVAAAQGLVRFATEHLGPLGGGAGVGAGSSDARKTQKTDAQNSTLVKQSASVALTAFANGEKEMRGGEEGE